MSTQAARPQNTSPFSFCSCLKWLAETFNDWTNKVNVTGIHSYLVRVQEHQGWGKISAMCLESWQRADQYYLVWDYVKLISRLEEHLFYWEQTTTSFITVLTKSLRISPIWTAINGTHFRGSDENAPYVAVQVCFNPVKHLKMPLWYSLLIVYSLFSPENIFPEGWCFLVNVMNRPALRWLSYGTRIKKLWPCDLDDLRDRYWWNSGEVTVVKIKNGSWCGSLESLILIKFSLTQLSCCANGSNKIEHLNVKN